MAKCVNLLIVYLAAVSISVSIATTPATSPPPADNVELSTILSDLGFQQLSAAVTTSNCIVTTIFAPSDSSLLTCPSCSIPLLLREHSVPGLYPLRFLRYLSFGTKIETLSPHRCLTLTSATSDGAIFINGVEITRPDIFNDGRVIIHGLQGYVSHLSPLSCNVELMTTLSFPPNPPSTSVFFMTRLLIKDVMLRLRVSGYSVLALALKANYYNELLNLRSFTVFALDDDSIFSGGHGYVSDLRFHIVPNMRLVEPDLVRLPVNTELRTMEPGENLVVTTPGDGGVLNPMRINYVKINASDFIYNNLIVVHVLSAPFKRIRHIAVEDDSDYFERSGSMIDVRDYRDGL